MRCLLLLAVLLTTIGLEACTDADREAMFSTDRAPLAGRCDPQPGYPPPLERPGCEYLQVGKSGRTK